jgi:hypothetical protein
MRVTENRKVRHLAPRVAGLALALALPAATAAPATAQEPEFALPAGVACAFPLNIDVAGGNQITREFFDKNGNLVRIITAGKGSTLTFTNADTGETLELRSNGSVDRTTINPDGTEIHEVTGHNVLILFPTDVPAGPSTTLHVGRVVFTVDAQDVFTVQSTSGRTTDICALLS